MAVSPKSESAGRSLTKSVSMLGLPPHKGCAELYESDTKAIHNQEYAALHIMYPMICYCDPAGPQKPCRFRADGHKGRIPTRRKLLYAAPAFAWQALWWHKSGHQKRFYVDDSPAANLSVLTLFSVFSVLIDAFTDPKMAIWTDNIRSKYGRRRPFMFLSAFFVPVVFVLSWTPLVPGGIAASVWFGVFHIGAKLADTLFTIPHAAWGAQLTPISNERTNCWMWRDIFANFGILFGVALLPMVFHDGEECYSTPSSGCVQMPLIAAGVGMLFTALCLLLTFLGKEPTYTEIASLGQSCADGDSATVVTSADPDKTIGSDYTEEDTIPALLAACLNRPFRILLITAFAKGAGTGVPFLLLPFVVPWVIGLKCMGNGLFTILAGAQLVIGISMVVPWTWIAHCLGKFRAYVGYNVSVLVTSMLFLMIGRDSGDCVATYIAIVVVALWGAAYGGSFLSNDVLCDAIDYDELLTGVKRREGAYMMAMEFIPKFVTIPGDCIPLLLMGALRYHRPVPDTHSPSCGVNTNTTLSADAFCANYYENEPMGGGWCSTTAKTCADLVADGVTFVCNDATGVCGTFQNDNIYWLFKMCFSVVPAFFVALGVAALYFYPKEAKGEAAHEKLLEAISKVRRGEVVEDPWRPGNRVGPACIRGPNFGALCYLWPSELRSALSKSSDGVDYAMLVQRPLVLAMLFLLSTPVGIYIMILGYPELADDGGFSVTPLGLMVIGIGLLGVWWQGSRARAAMLLKSRQVPREEVVKYVNSMCPFEALTPLPLEVLETNL